MEEGEKIALVLNRAAKLRFKISKSIGLGTGKGAKSVEDQEEVMERESRLFGIQEALESLENDLASLKDLHQRQRNEREAALAKIDHSRIKFLIELEEYKGEDLEIIHEAATIASETDPTLLPKLFLVNDEYTSPHLHPNNKLSENGLTEGCTSENTDDNESQRERQSKQNVMRFVLGLIAKSAISIVGIISVLSLAGFKPGIKKRGTSVNLSELFPSAAGGEREVSIQCPPDKVLVIEDGKARCLVKERIEIPFGSDFDSPNINIAFG